MWSSSVGGSPVRPWPPEPHASPRFPAADQDDYRAASARFYARIFKTTLHQMGNNTGIVVPPEVVEKLGGGKKPAVNVTVNGFAYRGSIATMAGQSMISFSSDKRAATGLKGGDEKIHFQGFPYQAGGDVILSVDGRKVVRPEDLARYIASKKPGDTVSVKILRDGAEKDVQVTLGERPDHIG